MEKQQHKKHLCGRAQMATMFKYPESFTVSVCSRPPSDRPPAPVNVSVTHLRSDSATVSWEVPEGDIIIGFSILQQVGWLLPLDDQVKVQSGRFQNKTNERGVSHHWTSFWICSAGGSGSSVAVLDIGLGLQTMFQVVWDFDQVWSRLGQQCNNTVITGTSYS